jgi:hypothetical protein
MLKCFLLKIFTQSIKLYLTRFPSEKLLKTTLKWLSMHTKPVQDHLDLLSRQHQNRLIHTLDEFGGLSQELSNLLDTAINRFAVEPYQNLAKKLQESATSMNHDFRQAYAGIRRKHFAAIQANAGSIELLLGLERYHFMFVIGLSELDKAQEFFQTAAQSLEERAQRFVYMRDSISQHIQMEVLPNEILDGERTLLGQGYFVIPTTMRDRGFFVFKYSQNPCCKDTRAIAFQPTSEYGAHSIEEAIAQHIPSNRIGSVIIARNTEDYPLSETVMPILFEKYTQKVKEQNYS